MSPGCPASPGSPEPTRSSAPPAPSPAALSPVGSASGSASRSVSGSVSSAPVSVRVRLPAVPRRAADVRAGTSSYAGGTTTAPLTTVPFPGTPEADSSGTAEAETADAADAAPGSGGSGPPGTAVDADGGCVGGSARGGGRGGVRGGVREVDTADVTGEAQDAAGGTAASPPGEPTTDHPSPGRRAGPPLKAECQEKVIHGKNSGNGPVRTGRHRGSTRETPGKRRGTPGERGALGGQSAAGCPCNDVRANCIPAVRTRAGESPVIRGAEGARSSLESLRPRYRAGEADLKSGPPPRAAAPPKVQAGLRPPGLRDRRVRDPRAWSCRRTSQVPMTDGEDIRCHTLLPGA